MALCTVYMVDMLQTTVYPAFYLPLISPLLSAVRPAATHCPVEASITVMKVLCCPVIDLERTRCPQCLTPESHRDGPSIHLYSDISLCLRTLCPCHIRWSEALRGNATPNPLLIQSLSDKIFLDGFAD